MTAGQDGDRGPARVGVIGCGNISGIYFENGRRFAGYEVISAADLDHSRAVAQQAKFGFEKAYSVDELLADPDVDLVLNLTIPAVHAAVGQQAIAAGKHVYAEKPLATDRADGQTLLDAAAALASASAPRRTRSLAADCRPAAS